MGKPDLEALVTPKIAEAIRVAVNRVGRTEFEVITGVDEKHLESLLSIDSEYVAVAVVTLACQINKNHDDSDPAHSNVSECLKGTTIRIPSGETKPSPVSPKPTPGSRVPRLWAKTQPESSSNYGKPFRLIGFSVNTATFLLLGYLLGGLLLSPLFGQPSCTGVSLSPVSLSPCSGSIVGIILGAFGGLGYTYYYFVRKL